MTRCDLYDAIWRVPAAELALRLGISGVGLAKICRRNGIPHPGRGHWAKVAHGYGQHRPPLPAPHDNPTIQIRTYLSGESVDAPDVTARVTAAASALETAIAAAWAGLANEPPHPLILQTQRFFRQRQLYERYGEGLPPPRDTGPRLVLSVSDETRPRALRLLNVLLKALEACGHRIEDVAQGACASQPCAIVYGERIPFDIREDTCGRLTLNLGLCGRRRRGAWRDGKLQRLEHLLPEFAAALIGVAVRRQHMVASSQRDEPTR